MPKRLNKFIIIISVKIYLTFCKTLFIFEHFRHGARGLSDKDEKDLDIYGEKWNGDSELTYSGMRQQFLLGSYIRNKYKNLIDYENYNPNEILAFSTNKNRAIMSARSQLIGIFKNSKIPLLKNSQNSMCTPYFLQNDTKFKKLNILYPENYIDEIPIRIIKDEDLLIRFAKKYLNKKMKAIREENKKKPEILDFIKRFNETFGEKLLKLFDINDKDYFTIFDNINEVCVGYNIDTFDQRKLLILNNSNINLTEFSKMTSEYSNLKGTMIYANDPEHLLGYIGSSVLMRKILVYMENILKNPNNPKIVLLSAHDTSILSMEDLIFVLFGIEIINPSFASSYIFELNQNQENNEYEVNFIFNDKILKTIKYDEFKNIILNKAWTLKQVADYCGFETFKFIKNDKEEKVITEKNDAFIWKISMITCIFFNLILIGIIIIVFAKKRNIEIKNTIMIELSTKRGNNLINKLIIN